jgi:predicted DNA-binding transcriptional regulator AlpA
VIGPMDSDSSDRGECRPSSQVVAASPTLSRTPDTNRSSASTTPDELGPSTSVPWMADRLMSIRDIRQLFGLGRTAAYELTHRRDFPEPVVISPRCYRWWASEVAAFTASMRRDGMSPRRPGHTRPAKERQAPHPGTSPRHISGTVRVARARRKAS